MNQRQINPIVSEFFFVFARMEYALKATGRFVKHRRNAEADWTKLASNLGNRFDEKATPGLKEAVEYYRTHPPKKQVVQDDQLEWDDTLPDHTSDLDLLFAYVRRVRNNLFHGGKFRGRYLAEPERSEQLIRHGLTILNNCLTLAPDLLEAFEQ